MKSTKHMRLVAAAMALTAFGFLGSASAVVLTFEGLGNQESVGSFYNGGLGGSGSGPGDNLGVEFSSNALAIIDSDAPGGSGSFGGEPSPSTILFFLSGGAATLNYAAGFDTGFSFYYAAVNNPGFINVFDGLNATGNLLATLLLPVTPQDGGDPTGAFSPFVPIGVNFLGVAKSVDFGGSANQIGFDNITFGSATPDSGDGSNNNGGGNGNSVPDGGASVALLGGALLSMFGLLKLKKN